MSLRPRRASCQRILGLTVAGNSAVSWALLSPVRWDHTGSWSLRLRDVNDILIILVYGKAIRFCSIHTKLSSRLCRSVLCVEYGCAVLLTAMLPMKMQLSLYYITTNRRIFLKSITLIPSLASLLVSIVARKHSKAESSESASVSLHCLAQ